MTTTTDDPEATARDAASSSPVVSRPRVEGDREQQILDATLEVLADVGYDRLTMDAVATAAHASKATLYRRWSAKSALVIDALCSHKEEHPVPDTGSLREDLLTAFCGDSANGANGADCKPGVPQGLADERLVAILASVMTAVGRDKEFAARFRRDFIEPKVAITTDIFTRAQARGEVRDDLDLELIAPALPGIVLHRAFMLGQLPDPAFITRVVDQIILPAVGAGQPHTSTTGTTPQTTKESR